MNTAATRSTRQAPERREPFTPVNQSAARSGIRPKLGWFLTVIEDRAAERTPDFSARWGIVYNAELRHDFGSDDTIGRLWKEAEDAGFLKRVWTKKGARIGFIWLRRLNDRPVATAETFDDVRNELVAAVNDRNRRAKTIRMRPEDTCTYRRTAGAPTAELRVHLPQNCGGSDPAPYSKRVRDLDPENTIKTTTTPPRELSSFFDPSTQEPEPERARTPETPAPVPIETDDPPSVPELPPELSAHQAILAAIIARFAALFGKTIDQARAAVVSLFGEFRVIAKVRGFRFEPEWIGVALEETEQAKAAHRIKRGTPWTYFLGILGNYAKQGGPVCEGPTENQARATLDELAARGWTIVLKSDGTAATGKIRADACPWGELPESLRRRIKEQEGPIRAWLQARQKESQSYNPRC